MDVSFFLSISIFAVVMSGTPGPNNIMLLASGGQYGYWRTMPHILGILVGVMTINVSVLFGLGLLFKLYPFLYNALKIVGGVYLLWLAWKIANATPLSGQLSADPTGSTKNEQGKPMSLVGAWLFQFVNPKAWTMSISSMSTFTLADDLYIASGLWIILAFILLGFIAISAWTGLGLLIRQCLTTPKRQRYFNRCMGGMTAATLLFILN
ncbi:LysE family translocator [Marinomonas agarivorans]|nr:LysE family translocator [Marinomonas agarivorans]